MKAIFRAGVIAGVVAMGLSGPALAQSASTVARDRANDGLRAGVAALKAGDAQGAIAKLTPVISSASLPAERAAFALFYRAAAHQRLRQYIRAIQDYSQAITLNAMSRPVLAMSHYNRGLSFEASGKSSAALNDFSRAITLNDRFAQAYNARADIMRKLGRHQDAIRDYQASLRYQHPQPYLSLYGQGLSHAALRQKAQARAAFERALVARPDFTAARDKLRLLDQGGDISRNGTGPGSRAARTFARGDNVVTGSIGDRTGAQPQSGSRPPPTNWDTRVAANRAPQTTGSIPPRGTTGTFVPGAGLRRAPGQIPVAALQRNAPFGSFLVQLSAQRDERAVRSYWTRLARAHNDVLGTLTPYVQRVDLAGRGVMYRLRAGPFRSREDVAQVCRVLQARGADCFVARANP